MTDLSAFPITRRWPAQHPELLQLYSLPTPNGVKVSIMLEEIGLPYEVHLVDFGKDDQKTGEFLSLNPNGKIPAMIDPNGPGGKPLALFESGAMLIYLADKAGRLLPKDPAALFDAVDAETAAVLLEPIQGETGIHVLSDELLLAARSACDRNGAALVFDEIQTGMGRTGTLWAYEQTPVMPDALTSAKALGGGLPIGALVTGPRLADVFQAGDHGSTFAGGPLVASAAQIALEICSDPALLDRVRAAGERLAAGLATVPYVAAVRGRGLMLAIDLETDPARPLDATELARRALLEQRLVVNATGPATIRLEPPLIVSDQELDEAVARLVALAP